MNHNILINHIYCVKEAVVSGSKPSSWCRVIPWRHIATFILPHSGGECWRYVSSSSVAQFRQIVVMNGTRICPEYLFA